MPTEHIDELRAQAKYARERYELYKAKAYGQRPTSEARLRELQRAHEQADERLRFALAEDRRSEAASEAPADHASLEG
ncbi:MAG TPA: hypothetical protein VHY83_05115 [Solirubrobacteraceae bacterium]|jgi:hypothetical protein|nr:hypothetical protein [Solirubrobacteraceae bacterium]